MPLDELRALYAFVYHFTTMAKKTRRSGFSLNTPMLGNVINDLAQLLANSHGMLPKETFESLVRIGGVLYREGNSQHRAKSDIDAIMKKSSRE